MFATNVLNLLNKKEILIFIDETGVNFDLHQKKAWIEVGKRFYYPMPKKSVNYTIVGGIIDFKFIAYCIVKGSCRQEDFTYFMNELHYFLWK